MTVYDWMNRVLLQWIYYEAGFLICSTIGIMVVILTPIIGICFCMCRCCENCGGEMHQRQRKNADCQRGFYTASLIATSIFIMWVVIISVPPCSSSLWWIFFVFMKNYSICVNLLSLILLPKRLTVDIKAKIKRCPGSSPRSSLSSSK